jgi:hypothetical protein
MRTQNLTGQSPNSKHLQTPPQPFATLQTAAQCLPRYPHIKSSNPVKFKCCMYALHQPRISLPRKPPIQLSPFFHFPIPITTSHRIAPRQASYHLTHVPHHHPSRPHSPITPTTPKCSRPIHIYHPPNSTTLFLPSQPCLSYLTPISRPIQSNPRSPRAPQQIPTPQHPNKKFPLQISPSPRQ